MGVKLFDLVEANPIDFKHLKGKVIAIDASLFMHQFLATIRGPDGHLLTTKEGIVTSHLVGLFSRTTRLIGEGIKVCYVFDGAAPELKKEEVKRRMALREEAEKKYAEHLAGGDQELARKFATRSSRLTKEMVEDAKMLLELLGIPLIQAPSEGEAQAARMTQDGTAWAIASQDGDCLVFGAKRQVRNLTISGKKKKPGTVVMQTIEPEMIEREKVLEQLGMSGDQLIVLAMLIGTDFNYGGIPGIGPVKAKKTVLQYGHDFERLFTDVKWSETFQVPWKDVFQVFKNIPTIPCTLVWKRPQKEKLVDILVNRWEFSEERVKAQLAPLEKEGALSPQKGLGDFV